MIMLRISLRSKFTKVNFSMKVVAPVAVGHGKSHKDPDLIYRTMQVTVRGALPPAKGWKGIMECIGLVNLMAWRIRTTEI